ncbi:MAG: excinuclease ABC subunit C [Chloroflexi bacterium RBG_13_51_36]|nr:MAG: excinuclease ABC subunit C [Chloroflexi bacterium RBG_13_51_36]
MKPEQLGTLPAKPGVYLLKDKTGKVIYVGKAASLNNRVRSYFGTPSNLPPKTQQLVSRIQDFEFVVTNSEQEALILECDMIKRYTPRYNASLKDSKTFPYLKIDIKEDWPRVCITRRVQKDKARYFGPFADAGSVRKTLRLIKKIFPYRSCSKRIDGNDKRPCLDYYIHQCLGPCVGAVEKQEYRDVINEVILFLQGKQELILRELNTKMKAAAQQLQFERAALLRDQIEAIEAVIEGQRIAMKLKGDKDVISLAQDGVQACVELSSIRNSKLAGHGHFIMEGIQGESAPQVMTSFVKQYYASASYIPPLILLQHPVDEPQMLSEWLGRQRGGKVNLQVPQRGAKKKLVDTAAENAAQGLQLAQFREMRANVVDSGLQELKDRLHLPELPERIECYDVSNIQGAFAVSSMVVLEKGRPKPAHYRRFRIKTVAGADDYAMIQETLRRRFKRGLTGEDAWGIPPDLVLIDGGRGQLNAGLEVRQELGLDSVPMASLAKENEEVFIPDDAKPVRMAKDSPALHVLQRARDEAHRFAITYHKKLRHREAMSSALDDVPGIGPRRKKALLRKFGSIEAIRRASLEELGRTEGLNLAVAQKVKQSLEDSSTS